MPMQGKMRRRQRMILHWAQEGLCAGCGRPVGLSSRGPKSRATYPTFDHVVPKSRGGGRVLINGLLKHRSCNEDRDDRPPTGCDRVWQMLVRSRLESTEASMMWSLEFRPQTHVFADPCGRKTIGSVIVP